MCKCNEDLVKGAQVCAVWCHNFIDVKRNYGTEYTCAYALDKPHDKETVGMLDVDHQHDR